MSKSSSKRDAILWASAILVGVYVFDISGTYRVVAIVSAVLLVVDAYL